MKRSRATPKAVTGFSLDVNEALKLKQELNNGETLSQQKILHVLQADKSCDNVCKGRKDNPNCFHGVVPAVGSVRRKGLWQKEPQGLMHLGADPSGLRRQVPLMPSRHHVMHLLIVSTSSNILLRKTCYHFCTVMQSCAGQQPSLWPQQPGQYMLCEQCSAMPFHDKYLQECSVPGYISCSR